LLPDLVLLLAQLVVLPRHVVPQDHVLGQVHVALLGDVHEVRLVAGPSHSLEGVRSAGDATAAVQVFVLDSVPVETRDVVGTQAELVLVVSASALHAVPLVEGVGSSVVASRSVAMALRSSSGVLSWSETLLSDIMAS
jgi:hypothetical protein